jgi:hypothetical protein
MGAMIRMLGGNSESVEAWRKVIGKPIASIALGDDDVLRIATNDGTKIAVSDHAQSCCESRYMRTDDDLSQFVGATLVNGEIRPAPEVEDGGETHEVEFLVLVTDRGNITFSSHNEHNGYYGGFSVEARIDG